MAETPRKPPVPASEPPTGLRLRIWIGCIATALLGAAAVLGIAGTFLPTSGVSPELIAVLPWAGAGLPLLAGILFAMWLARGIVRPLRDMNRAMAMDDPAARDRLEDQPAWGELRALAASQRSLLERFEASTREAQELRAARQRLEAAHAELWAVLSRSAVSDATPAPGDLDAARRAIEERGAREAHERAGLRERAASLGSEMAHDLALAREAAEHAERGFVEATGMLSSLRELERLLVELGATLESGAQERGLEAERQALDGFRDAASAAIEELAGASAASVERLADGLRAVRAIAEQVQVLGNRATMIALEAATRREPDPAAGESLRALTRDAQDATARTRELARDVDREVNAASERMRGVRRRTAEALAGAPRPAESQPGVVPLDHRIERLRATLTEATARGERLAASGERASSAVERLVRRIDAGARALDELIGALDAAEPGGGA